MILIKLLAKKLRLRSSSFDPCVYTRRAKPRLYLPDGSYQEASSPPMEAHFSLHRGASALAGGGPALRERLSAVSEYPGLAPRAAATPRRRSPGDVPRTVHSQNVVQSVAQHAPPPLSSLRGRTPVPRCRGATRSCFTHRHRRPRPGRGFVL